MISLPSIHSRRKPEMEFFFHCAMHRRFATAAFPPLLAVTFAFVVIAVAPSVVDPSAINCHLSPHSEGSTGLLKSC